MGSRELLPSGCTLNCDPASPGTQGRTLKCQSRCCRVVLGPQSPPGTPSWVQGDSPGVQPLTPHAGQLCPSLLLGHWAAIRNRGR